MVINEIMYAPANGSNYEWVEVFNSGTLPVDLQGWRFFHGENNSGPLTLRNGNTTVLQPSGYAIIAKSPSVVTNYIWLNFSGMILSASTLSLPDGVDNTHIAIASDTIKTISNSVIYDTSLGGNKDSGNSLQKRSGSWVAATPTPGKENETASAPPSSSDEDSSSDTTPVSTPSTQGEPKPKTKTAEIPKIKTKITAKTLTFTGIPVEFSANTTGYSNEPLLYGKYFWNFGDGDSKETKVGDTAKFTHTFFYEGEYNIALEYYMNYYSENPDASNGMTIKVVPTNVSISKVGDEKDFFVEIKNNTDYDADLSKWILSSDQKNFTLPKNMILDSQRKIILSPKITGFSVLDKDTLKLKNPQGETVFDYSVQTKPAKILAKDSVSVKLSATESAPDALQNDTSGDNAKIEVSTDDLLAQTVKSDESTGGNFKYGVLGLFVFLGIGASTAYFIRNHNRGTVPQTSGNDFEIMDG